MTEMCPHCEIREAWHETRLCIVCAKSSSLRRTYGGKYRHPEKERLAELYKQLVKQGRPLFN